MKRHLTASFKAIMSLVPKSALKFTYLTLLSPKPLRFLANRFIIFFIPSVLKIEEGKVFIDKSDVGVSSALAFGIHDPFEIELFRKSIDKGMKVVDVGANIGYYTVIAGVRVGDSGQVFAYEPEEKNFNLLQRNISENKLSCVKTFKMGLSDKVGIQPMYVSDTHSGIHSFANNRNSSNTVQIETDTLDHSLRQSGVQSVDIIKIDIEGAEIMALKGMQEIIKNSTNLKIFIEIYPQAIERLGYAPTELLTTLDSFGFSLHVLDEERKNTTELFPKDFDTFIKNFPKKGEVVKNLYGLKK